MEERKLTKADIDKVRGIEGFPIAKDEDIIALSRPPYYTACPNPFIADFIAEHGTSYDEATDDYHREPFAADVSEGKNDPIYNAHSYHTKVPHKAIMRYILHYTKPGDIVFDGFCGTGMTGVAAQMCDTNDMLLRATIEHDLLDEKVEWGARKAILNDLSPAASFIAYSYNAGIDVDAFRTLAEQVVSDVDKNLGWMYETQHTDEKGRTIVGIDGNPTIGRINYTVWSDVFICPSCSSEIIFYNAAYDPEEDAVKDQFACPHCQSLLRKADCKRAQQTRMDIKSGKTISEAKQIPVLIAYTAGGKKYVKKPDQNDLDLIARIDKEETTDWYPTCILPKGPNTEQPLRSHGAEAADQFYTRRNLIALAKIWSAVKGTPLQIVMQSISASLTSRLVRYNMGHRGNGVLNGTLYLPSLVAEGNVLKIFAGKVDDFAKAYILTKSFPGSMINLASATDLQNIPESCIDYIFTDPPFGANINYSELSSLWESWLAVMTNQTPEAIINDVQKKTLFDYQELMERSFREFYRILKPGRWMTVEFHNSKNAVWNSIQESLGRVGFIIADVRTLDKKQGSFKQATTATAVKQDLVISAYKPRESFVRQFQQRAGDPDMAWEFVRQHLRNVPVTADGNHDGKLDIIAERQDYLLFDRMVAWHIMNGIPVPMDAHTFYEGLRQRFLERDGMFFLPDQVNEYDDKRAHMELDTAQLSFVVTDEKNAIQWLNYVLADHPMTYQEIQPLYMQELHQSRQEKMPELLDMLKENFVQDEKGAWYVPDLTNAADLAKVRRKALLKEFWDSCATGKGKLKVFRMEAIRAGFDECWKTRDFKTIVAVGERLPEAVLQEDPALLMYYDNACSRI